MTALSAIDFLGLAEQKRVARVDLADVGYQGVVYVCDLSTAQQQEIMSVNKNAKVRTGKDWTEFDMSALANNAGSKFLAACLVTDSSDGDMLDRAFAAAEGVDYIQIAASELVLMADVWVRELGNRAKMLAKLDEMPNAVTSLIVKTVRNLSGMGEADAFEEKKAD
jgi:hypothetical protein